MASVVRLDPAAIEELAEGYEEVFEDLGLFGGLLPIRTKNSGKVPFGWETWHPEQRRFEAERTGRDIVLKPRQIGFSTLELARDVQFVRTHEGVQVVIVVHTGKAKTELFAAVHLMVRALESRGLLSPDDAKENTKTGLRWSDNDSSISVIEAGKDASTAADQGRSGTIHRLHCTEAAYYRAPEETMAALLEALGVNECVIESTANGTGNWFHESVEAARVGAFIDFRFHFFSWLDHPTYRADPRAYPSPPVTEREQRWERELRRLGADASQIAFWRGKVQSLKIDKALRDYPPTADAAFATSGEKWIDPEHIDRLRRSVIQPIEFLELADPKFGPLRIYERPVPGRSYVLAADPSEGVGKNEAAIVIIDHRSGRLCAAWHNAKVKPGDLGHVVAAAGRHFNTALAAVEKNKWRPTDDGGTDGGRETINVLLRDEHYPERRVYHHAEGKPGWSTNEQTRPLIWWDLYHAITDDDDPVDCSDARLVSEAAALERDPKRIARAPGKHSPGGSDDGLFVAWGIARQVRQATPPARPIRAQAVGPTLVSRRIRT